ncbi:alpha/beta fold hydrolase [Kamptonema animale CS-326]|jgi:alpha-beta hydrolase superfamily lysophospholipase|uniref:alpha/beta hydrolase n=1 Tax=Kamptonema animale TaxID=92934 RepID=UPI00232B5FC0|nr:alpha/beta fold hydrolase [Kamptonema animale]MDB9511068.1 alpha/beta fold hydrolase [Kamptonema animale CS-326]
MQPLTKIELGRKSRKHLCQLVVAVFFVLNVLSYTGAYVLTHFSSPGQLGLGLPRPTSSKLPTNIGLEYITQRIPISQNEWLETWFIPAQSSVSGGTVLLFPGNAGSKAKQLLAPTQVFHSLGYDTLLVDFRGVGGSSGNTTTLGVREAKDVALTMSYAQRSNFKRPLVLYGVSMGSAAILKAVALEQVNPDAVILELPFARLLNAVRSRLREIRVPTFPMAEMLVFWGSIQHGFNGFTHNPVTYASKVKCPTLLLHGKLDKWTTVAEIDRIFQNLHGSKQLVIFPNSGHNLLVTVDKEHWKRSIDRFLKGI